MTVDTQPNPTVYSRGTRDADAVIITSQLGITDNEALAHYQILNRQNREVINIDSRMSTKEGGNIVDVTVDKLKIILPFRTQFSVRVKYVPNGSWSSYVNFTTRDKRYQTPDAITQLTDDTNSTAKTGDAVNRTIIVTNNARAIENDDLAADYNTPRKWGNVTVQNTDPIYSDGQLVPNTGRLPVEYHATLTATQKGARVVNIKDGKNTQIVYTARGATITTNP